MPGRFWLAVSIVLHLAVWWGRSTPSSDGPAPSTSAPLPVAAVVPSVLVRTPDVPPAPPAAAVPPPPPERTPDEPAVEAPVVEKEPIAEAPADGSSDPPPPDYAAAPPAPTPEKPAEDVPGDEPTLAAAPRTEPPTTTIGDAGPPPAPGSPAPGAAPPAVDTGLPPGTVADPDGLRAPAYRLEELGDAEVDRLLRGGHACLCAFDGERTLIVELPPDAPLQLRGLSTSPWRTRLARRMLPLPDRQRQALEQRLRSDYAFAAPPRIRLGLSTTLDAAILAVQRRAVAEAGLALGDCAETRGRLRFDDAGRPAFEVIGILPR